MAVAETVVKAEAPSLAEVPAERTAVVVLGERGVAASVGAYSEREFFLDAPEAFVDFVIEAMRPELADYDVQV